MQREFKCKSYMLVRVSPEWLVKAWYGKTQFKTPPVACISNNHLKITTFKEYGQGMRSLSTVVNMEYGREESAREYCFEIPNGFRAYLHHLQFAKEVRLRFEKHDVHIVAETPSFAIQYKIQHLAPKQDVYIQTSSADISLEVGTEDWMHICQTMPHKGQITIECHTKKRMLTIKHSKNNWGACLMARSKALAYKKFVCGSDIIRFCFKPVENLPAFGSISFMECGVFKWESGYMKVYLAPQTDE